MSAVTLFVYEKDKKNEVIRLITKPQYYFNLIIE